jgi:4-amino-4-deoxy-L-arabinose transferase-like glycosyltransferase
MVDRTADAIASPAGDAGSWRRDRILLALLLGALAIRLVHLDAPIIGIHAWRQSDTAAMARNYYENGYDFAHPQIDAAGAGDGSCETEFPLYPFVVALLYRTTGVWEGWGRLVSALCSVLGMVFLHALVRRTSGRGAALWSTAFLGFLPLSAFYSRAFMPEAMMLMGSAAGIDAFERWTRTGAWRWWLLALAATMLACLLKITSLYLGLPLAWLAWRRWGLGFLRRPAPWLFALLVFAAVALWYGHAHRVGREAGQSFGIWGYGTDKWGQWHLLATWGFWNDVVFRSLAERHITWPAVPLVVVGLILPRRRRDERLFDWWLAGVLAYVVIAQKGNLAHEYYQLPALLPLAAVLGRTVARGLDRSTRWPLALGTAAAVALSIGDGAGRYANYLARENAADSWQLALARLVQEKTGDRERGLFVQGGDPTLLYLSHRKGWRGSADTLSPADVANTIRAGATFLAARAEDLPPWLQEQYGVAGEELLVAPIGPESAPPPP